VLTVAVTGGIGAGKSTVARMLEGLGAVVVDSDRLARDVVAPGTDGLAAVAAEFGPEVVGADGALDRAALAETVFADRGARERLERIVHPRVRAAFAARRDAAGPNAIVVNDIPLVRTAAEAAPFDLVITVTASEDVRLARLVRRGLTEDDARSRVAAQVGDHERRALTDVWIDNDGDEARLRAAVDRVWAERIVRGKP
jgi:dephospho-CoA kinase